MGRETGRATDGDAIFDGVVAAIDVDIEADICVDAATGADVDVADGVDMYVAPLFVGATGTGKVDSDLAKSAR